MKIGLLVVATHKYMMFADPLVASVREHFMRDTAHETTVFLFTNRRRVPDGAVRIHQKHRPFPYPALMRYHVYHRGREVLSKMDCLCSCDVDMRFVSRVGEEIRGESVATIHPYFYRTPADQFTSERRARSTAYIPLGAGTHYFCGAFNGGTSASFLAMAETISRNVDADRARGITAEWHDESHLNRYLLDHPPTTMLSPSCGYPEGQHIPYDPGLLALAKTHLKPMLREPWLAGYRRRARAVVRRYLVGRR